LNVAPCLLTRIQKPEQSFDDGIKVGKEGIPFNALTEIDERRGSMSMHSWFGIFQSWDED
jgi:hypothetical protein